jgi:hypothetical protein
MVHRAASELVDLVHSHCPYIFSCHIYSLVDSLLQSTIFKIINIIINFYGARDWTQFLTDARQALYQLSYIFN